MAVLKDRDGVDVIHRDDLLPVAGIRSIFPFMPVVAVLGRAGAVRTIIGEVLRPRIGQTHLARALEPLLESHLERMVVGVECRFQGINGAPAIIRPHCVDARDIGAGEDRRVRSGRRSRMQSRGEGASRIRLVDIRDPQQVRALRSQISHLQHHRLRELTLDGFAIIGRRWTPRASFLPSGLHAGLQDSTPGTWHLACFRARLRAVLIVVRWSRQQLISV